MKGERLAQYELAFRLGKCRQEFLRGTTSEEFNDWLVFLEMKMNEKEPIHYYLAQIAHQIFGINFMFSKKKNPLKIKDFLFEFETADQEKKAKPVSEKEKKSILAKSKQFWIGGVSRIIKSLKQENTEETDPRIERERINGRHLHPGKARRSHRH